MVILLPVRPPRVWMAMPSPECQKGPRTAHPNIIPRVRYVVYRAESLNLQESGHRRTGKRSARAASAFSPVSLASTASPGFERSTRRPGLYRGILRETRTARKGGFAPLHQPAFAPARSKSTNRDQARRNCAPSSARITKLIIRPSSAISASRAIDSISESATFAER